MAIKGGSFITNANGTLIDRIQTGGPGALNIPQEKIYELGNWFSVGTVYDIPDITFTLNSLDVSCEFESKLINKTPHALIGDSTAGAVHKYDIATALPLDITSPFKSQRNAYDIVKGIIVPYLNLESATYRFGVGQSATQEFQLRGDSIYYTPGIPYYQEFSYVGTAGETHTLTFPGATGGTAATSYIEGSNTIHVYCVTLVNATTGAYKRLFYGNGTDTGYTDTATTVTVTGAQTGYDTLRVAYGGNGAISYPQSVHQGTAVKPAAVRGKDIEVWIGTVAATPTFTKFTGVQTAEIDWKVTLDADQELGNVHYVAQDYDVPDVTGSLTVKPFDVATLWTEIYKVTGVNNTQTIGPSVTVPLPMYIAIKDPDGNPGIDMTGTLKTFYVPDARFTVPGMQGQANSKLTTTFSFTSDTGVLYIYDGGETTFA